MAAPLDNLRAYGVVDPLRNGGGPPEPGRRAIGVQPGRLNEGDGRQRAVAQAPLLPPVTPPGIGRANIPNLGARGLGAQAAAQAVARAPPRAPIGAFGAVPQLQAPPPPPTAPATRRNEDIFNNNDLLRREEAIIEEGERRNVERRVAVAERRADSAEAAARAAQSAMLAQGEEFERRLRDVAAAAMRAETGAAEARRRAERAAVDGETGVSEMRRLEGALAEELKRQLNDLQARDAAATRAREESLARERLLSEQIVALSSDLDTQRIASAKERESHESEVRRMQARIESSETYLDKVRAAGDSSAKFSAEAFAQLKSQVAELQQSMGNTDLRVKEEGGARAALEERIFGRLNRVLDVKLDKISDRNAAEVANVRHSATDAASMLGGAVGELWKELPAERRRQEESLQRLEAALVEEVRSRRTSEAAMKSNVEAAMSAAQSRFDDGAEILRNEVEDSLLKMRAFSRDLEEHLERGRKSLETVVKMEIQSRMQGQEAVKSVVASAVGRVRKDVLRTMRVFQDKANELEERTSAILTSQRSVHRRQLAAESAFHDRGAQFLEEEAGNACASVVSEEMLRIDLLDRIDLARDETKGVDVRVDGLVAEVDAHAAATAASRVAAEERDVSHLAELDALRAEWLDASLEQEIQREAVRGEALAAAHSTSEAVREEAINAITEMSDAIKKIESNVGTLARDVNAEVEARLRHSEQFGVLSDRASTLEADVADLVAAHEIDVAAVSAEAAQAAALAHEAKVAASAATHSETYLTVEQHEKFANDHVIPALEAVEEHKATLEEHGAAIHSLSEDAAAAAAAQVADTEAINAEISIMRQESHARTEEMVENVRSDLADAVAELAETMESAMTAKQEEHDELKGEFVSAIKATRTILEAKVSEESEARVSALKAMHDEVAEAVADVFEALEDEASAREEGLRETKQTIEHHAADSAAAITLQTEVIRAELDSKTEVMQGGIDDMSVRLATDLEKARLDTAQLLDERASELKGVASNAANAHEALSSLVTAEADERKAALDELRGDMGSRIDAEADERRAAEAALREELNGEMSSALEKQANLLGSSLEEVEGALGQVREDLGGQIDAQATELRAEFASELNAQMSAHEADADERSRGLQKALDREVVSRRETADELRAEFATRLTATVESALTEARDDTRAVAREVSDEVNALSLRVTDLDGRVADVTVQAGDTLATSVAEVEAKLAQETEARVAGEAAVLKQVDTAVSNLDSTQSANLQAQATELRAEFATQLTTAVEGAVGEFAEKLDERATELKGVASNAANAHEALSSLVTAEADERKAALDELRGDMGSRIDAEADERRAAEAALREELNGEMSSALEKQANLLGSSLEEVEGALGQVREDLGGQIDAQATELRAEFASELNAKIAAQEADAKERMSTLENAVERESKARQDGTEEVKAEFAARLTTAVEGALSEVNAKLADSEVQFTGMSEEMQKRLGELSESTGNASVELVAAAKREMEALFQVESDQRKLAEEKVLEAIQEQERRAEAERVEREAAEKQLRDELQKELESFNDQRTTAETSLREELNGEMSNALEKQADLLGSSLEEMETSISQLRDDMVGRLDDESGVLIATKEELTNLVGGERKEREAETAEIRAELATQLAASMTETSEGVKDDLARAIEDVRASGVAASESLNERIEQLGHDVAEMKAKQDGEPSVPSVTKEELEAVRASGVAASESLNERVEQMGHDVAEMKAKQDGEPSVPSVTKEELEALVGDERKEREAGTAELRAELATQLAAGIEEVRSSGVAASESLNERVEQLGHDVAEMKAKQDGEPSVPSVTKEELEALVGDERKEREAGTAELRAELATQLAAGIEEVRSSGVAASESLNERVEQLGHDVAEVKSVPSVTKEELEALVGDERKEREAGTAELRAELATQLAAGVEEVRANVVAASESLNERVEQLNDAVRKEETDRKVSVESLKGFVQGFVAANSPRPVAAQGGE